MKRSIIIGMGIGQLYRSVLTNLGHEIITVDRDPTKNADYTDLETAIEKHTSFDTAHICTPNFTHFQIAEQVAPVTKAVFIEKPGFANSKEWSQLITEFPQTHFMMVKNNMWRDNIELLRDLAKDAKTVNFNWINKDRVPSPGTWFTTRELAFGGVSRDLMPHLLSLFIALNPEWEDAKANGQGTQMKWQLKDLTTTDYGTVKIDGTYNVDDFCHINFGNKWNLTADWRSMDKDKRNIEFVMKDNTEIAFELGLCPEEAYTAMIKDAVSRIGQDHDWWNQQFEQDIWIHERIENI